MSDESSESGQAGVEVTSLPETVLQEGFDYLILSSEGDVSLGDYRASVAVVVSALRAGGWGIVPPGDSTQI